MIMETVLLILFALALGLSLGWLLIHALVKNGVFTPKAGKAIFGFAVAATAFCCVLGVFFATVYDPERDILVLFGIVVAMTVCVAVPFAIRVGKANRAEQARLAEEQKADPSFAPTPEEAEKQEASRKRWTVVLYVIVGIFILYHLLRFVF